ncbi:WhiB family transcriptional regulator [Marmoricola sp. RAF53]|uniref:WhiB family transcriptional regulator n=1 Tax=Marmoricola sp. RAF53 TaxID=3233059 RepID=UPI003F952E73
MAAGQAWDAEAACLEEDPELFFPVSRTARAAEQLAEARAVCRRCPVQAPCLEFALRTGAEEGVWGGLDPDARRQLRRMRTRSA